jgi:hypothetical protein
MNVIARKEKETIMDERGSAQNGGSNLTYMHAKDWQQAELFEQQAAYNRFLFG